jgi:hypothetical protein
VSAAATKDISQFCLRARSPSHSLAPPTATTAAPSRAPHIGPSGYRERGKKEGEEGVRRTRTVESKKEGGSQLGVYSWKESEGFLGGGGGGRSGGWGAVCGVVGVEIFVACDVFFRFLLRLRVSCPSLQQAWQATTHRPPPTH